MDCETIFNSVNVRPAQRTGAKTGKGAGKTGNSTISAAAAVAVTAKYTLPAPAAFDLAMTPERHLAGVMLPRPPAPMMDGRPLRSEFLNDNCPRLVGTKGVQDARPFPEEVSVGAAMGSGDRLTGAPVEFERAYRAVLVADVVGYTRLMEAAEIDTHKHYRALRLGVIDPVIGTHRGQVVKNTGDGYVAVFEAPLDALRCAIALQQEVSEHQAGHPADGRIEFRIGIHWEPVIFDLNDVFGRGVNIAVRLQTIAPTGGIAISSALLSEVGALEELKIDDLGEIRLKNLTRLVHAYSVVLPGVRRGVDAGVGGASGPAKLPSIAVLPFSNFSNDPNRSHFAEGFVEDIIVTLSNIPDLLVVSRGSTLSCRRPPADAHRMGERLGVQYVVSGRVRRSGKHVRLSIELADVTSGAVMWAEKYDLLAQEVLAVQDEIARNIVANVATHVRKAQVTRVQCKPPQSLNAYDYLVRALDLLYRFDSDSFLQGRELLEGACGEDRCASSAQWQTINTGRGWLSTVDADTAEVVRLCRCAIDRAPSNALAPGNWSGMGEL